MENALTILQTIISLLTGGITSISTAIGTGISNLVSSIMFASGELSVFATVMFIFMGVSLSIGLCRFILNWVTSLGKR